MRKPPINIGDVVYAGSEDNRTIGFVERITTLFLNRTKKVIVEIAFKNNHCLGWETKEFPLKKVKRLGEITMEDIKIGDKVSVFTGEDFISVKITKINRSKKGNIVSLEGVSRNKQTYQFSPHNLAGRC